MKRSPQKQIELLEQLEKHGGWHLLMEEARKEIDAVTRQLAYSTDVSSDELHWRRGMLAASLLILEMPTRLKDRIKLDLQLKAPATAGQKGTP